MLSRITTRTALIAVIAAGLAACTPSGTPLGDSSPTPDATAVLTAALARTSATNLTFMLLADNEAESPKGAYDAASRYATFTQPSGGDTLTMTLGPDDLYLAGLADLKGQTIHAQIAKLATANPISVFADPLAALTMLSGVTEVEASGADGLAGTLDLTTAHGSTAGARAFLAYVLRLAGDRAGKVPFTVKISADGYVTEFSATLPAIDDGKDGAYVTRFADFGAPVTVAIPAGPKVIEAPDSFYSAP
jgi:hypothetical protein